MKITKRKASLIGVAATTLLIVPGFTGCVYAPPEPHYPDDHYSETVSEDSSLPETVSVINTYKVTNSELSEEYFANDKLVTMVRYYEMSDGTWKTDTNTYKYRLEITGRLNGAVKDSTYVYLSNIEEITFEQAWKAAGLSSNSEDYFDPSEAVLVEMK